MNELKTLKDLDLRENSCEIELVSTQELKAEAVKWIKWLRNYSIILILRTEDPEEWDNYNVEDWIKHFFNLTEEDLK